MWANLEKVMKLEKLAHFQSELTFLVKWSLVQLVNQL